MPSFSFQSFYSVHIQSWAEIRINIFMDWLSCRHLLGLHLPFLLAAQTAGALLSNALWGWWGDRYGKRSLYEGVALLRAVPPLLIIVWSSVVGIWPIPTIFWFATVFFLLGAVGNGITIAVIGYLMEISPDDQRSAYSGYFNSLVAPAALLPLAGAAVVETTSLTWIFAVSLGAAFLQFMIIRRLRDMQAEQAK